MKEQIIKENRAKTCVKAPLLSSHRRLLSRSVSSLTPHISSVGFNDRFDRLDKELGDRGIKQLKIEKYFGDEWFCPTQSTAIAIPFWLADEKLMQIERELVGFVEGETDDEFMRLLRHEAGHCVDHAYGLSKRGDWRKIFGDPGVNYDPDSAATIPGHPDFVENLSGGYAQTHPEEDFAETFAVWLATSGNERGFKASWSQIYRSRPAALRKLLFVDQLMQEVCNKKPKKLTNQKICNARRIRKSLGKYYSERLQHLEKTPYSNASLH